MDCEVIPFFEDDLFIFSPSMLCEGKSVGTAKRTDLILAKNYSVLKDADPSLLALERKRGQTVGKVTSFIGSY